MNIWQWVRETRHQLYKDEEHRLANLIDTIPSYACQDEHAELDAAVPEALAHARRLELGWAELFIRHWNLQSRILHRMETGEYLSEAIDLLEFAHREENVSCPQSVCTTQDLAVAYGQRDGKGFAPERLKVASETLERIDPTWQCFECISNEYASALIDDGRSQEALDFLGEQHDAIHESCPGHVATHRTNRFHGNISTALERLDKKEEALALVLDDIQRLERENQDTHQLQHRRIKAARLLAELGRGEEGLEVLPPWEVILPTPTFYTGAGRAFDALCEADILENSWLLGRRTWVMAQKLAQNGVIRQAIELCIMHATRALQRAQPWIASCSIELLDELLPKLRAPWEATEQISELKERQASMMASQADEAPVFQNVEESLGRVAGEDPEEDLATLRAAYAQFPEEDDVLFSLANAIDAIGFSSSAHALLEEAFEAHPTMERMLRLGGLLLQDGRIDKLEQFIAQRIHEDGELGTGARWLLAQLRWKQQANDEAIDALARIIEDEPEWVSPRSMRAHILRAEGRYEEALEMLNAQIEQFPDVPPGDTDWDRMAVATLVGDWERVHESAKRLGFSFETTEGPIDEPVNMCILSFQDEPDAPSYWAVRNGPVTARVVEMARVRRAQHFEDVVVFEASTLTPRPPDLPEDQPHYDTFAVIAPCSRGGYHESFAIHGVCPSEAQLEALVEALAEKQIKTNHLETEGYMLHLPDSEESSESAEAMYMTLAIPLEADLHEVHALLTEATADFEHPLQWTRLLRVMDADQALIAEHQDITKRYGMLED